MKIANFKRQNEPKSLSVCLFCIFHFSLCVLQFLALLAAPAWAQGKGWVKEWNAPLAAAKKEGSVVVAGSPDPVMRGEIIPKFMSRFGIPVEFIAGRSSQIVARVATERSAGIYSIDVYLSGPDTTA